MSRAPVLAAIAVAVAFAVALLSPSPALAHGLVGRADLPIPTWLFGWAAGAVLVISFVALAALWRTPRLEGREPRRLVRVPRWIDVVCGVVGVALFAFLVFAGLTGAQAPTDNIVPTFVYVVFWVGLVVVSAVLGDVFRPFNPWRAVARGVSWVVRRAGMSVPPALDYPQRLGRWPAVAGLVAFGWLELVAPDGNDPSLLATLALAYAAVQWVGMATFGIDRWTDRGDAFSVYFGLFARIAPLDVVDRHLVVRRPLSALADLRWLPGTVALLCAAIGITAFDGASEGAAWNAIAPELNQGFRDAGAGTAAALQLAFSIGLVAGIAIAAAFYRLGVEGMRSTARMSAGELSRQFVHSLVPIALAYVFAHYFSLLVFQGQALAYLVSDPLGDGSDLFATANSAIDYTVVSATTVWYVQVAALVIGHAAALAVAHDRALVVFEASKRAVRSQYGMLVVMVGFTSLGLWLLSAANA
jgi:hypothetical protein